MKVVFWLLDVNYEIRNGLSELWLWGIDDSGKRVLIIDRGFVDYFYAVVEENTEPAAVIEEINKKHYDFVLKLEAVDRRFFGKPVKAIRVFCKNPETISKLARDLRNFEGVKDCLEDDIRYSMRYLIDNNAVPCAWHDIEAVSEKCPEAVQVDRAYNAKSSPRLLEKADAPTLRILGFSMTCYSREGSPKPDRNPVIMISIKTNSGEEKQLLADESRNDKAVLEAFMDYVRCFNPDIIVGYGVNGHDWLYLIERCKHFNLKLPVGRTCAEPHTSVYSHVSLTGRVDLDLADYAEEFPDVKVKTLANLADFLGVLKLEKRTVIEDIDVADCWDDQAKREVLKRFCLDNARCVMGVAEAVLDFAMQLSSLVGLPLDHVGTAAAGHRVEWFLMKRTHSLGELVPKRIEQPYRPYAGGLVLQPTPGLHDDIVALDFKSLYPNLMRSYNLSPDTYVAPDEPMPAGGVYEAPEVNHKFRKKSAGFYKETLSYLISARDDIRFKMKKISSESVEYRVLDARQKAVKIITNAMYGYAGWTGARWYVKPVAEAAAAWGRDTISTAIKMAEAEGLKVIYGDTDSIFVNNDSERIARLSKEIEEKLGLEIRPDKIYVRIFFTEAKKRYAGLLTNGHLDIVGLEVMRGDWADVARNVQENVLEIILKEQSPLKAVEFVHKFIRELRQKHVPFRSLIIWKTLTKPAEEYQVKASHVEAARMMKQRGWELAVGDKIGYVVVAGSGRLYERVKPYVLASYNEVDIDYYVSKQVIPATARILESFGITEEQLLKSEGNENNSRRISDFFSS